MELTGTIPLNTDDAEVVEVPGTTCPLTQSDFSELCRLIDPASASASDNFGMDQYLGAVHFTERKISQFTEAD